MRFVPAGFRFCAVHCVLFRDGTTCLACPSITFSVVHGRSALEWDRYRFDERHTCGTADTGACRGCAQARVVHDGGDEDPAAFAGRRGTWLVGGGRDADGALR